MYKIKQLPSDFAVSEISDVNLESSGQYAYFTLKKIGYTTVDALQAISQRLKIPLKHFGFAGNKDRNAVTEQKISVFRESERIGNIKIKNIELKYLGRGKKPISLGDLNGNEFVITIRNLTQVDVKKIKMLQHKRLKIPNLYGPQRFGRNNHLVGKAILKKDFRKAIKLVLEGRGLIEEEIKDYLKTNKNNYIEALRLIPLKTRKLLVHSYQSFLFNRIADEYLNHAGKNEKIPIIGFGFELGKIKDTKLRKIIKKIIDNESISPRDFITSQMPELASEGGFRDLFFDFQFKLMEAEADELNKNRQKIKIQFALPKSCYATVALEYAFR